MSLARPGRNQFYANYLMGLGIGLIMGSIFASPAKFPSLIVAVGVIDVIVGLVIYFRAGRKVGG